MRHPLTADHQGQCLSRRRNCAFTLAHLVHATQQFCVPIAIGDIDNPLHVATAELRLRHSQPKLSSRFSNPPNFLVNGFSLQFFDSQDPSSDFIAPSELLLHFPFHLSQIVDLVFDFLPDTRADEVVQSETRLLLVFPLALHIKQLPLMVLSFDFELPELPTGLVLLSSRMSILDFSLCDLLVSEQSTG